MKSRKHQPLLRLLVVYVLLTVVLSLSAQPAADGQLYALLISGGRNRLTNHERYWNDCAFLYRTLQQRYHLSKSNITVLMSDGFDPADDMVRADGTALLSSPVDLDGDGLPDISGAATMEMLTITVYRLARQLTERDHLFLFFTDHGGTTDGVTASNLWLWDDRQLADYQLALLMELLPVKTLTILMGQCNSGGFIDDLQHDGRIVMTACAGDEKSWICPDRDYDEFLYHWICAVNGADEYGNTVYADRNGNGSVSMEEAFLYARSHDRTAETPQYASWPSELGSQWSFDRLISTSIRQVEAMTGDRGEVDSENDVYDLQGRRVSNSSLTTRHSAQGRGLRIVRHGGSIRKVVR